MRLRTFVVETMVPEAVSVAASMTCINLIASVELQITTSLVAGTMSTTAFDGALTTMPPPMHSRRSFPAR
jgi:hypothetical protein